MAYIGKSPVLGNFIKLDAITTSSTATYTMNYGGSPYSPQSVNHMLVSLNGVIQAPSDAYTVSGSTITFSSTLSASDVIDFIMVYGNVLDIGTPSDSTVGFSKITSNLITGATAETSIAGGDQILIYDDSATALRKMTRTNFVAGVGGVNTPAFYADRNSSQTLTTATLTTILFNSELFDTNSNYDTTTGRFTPTTAGKYLVYANLVMGDIGDQKFNLCEIHKNGSVVDYGQIFMSGAGSGGTSSASSIIDCNGTTDYISVVGYHNKGSNANVEPNSVFFGFKLIE